MRRAARSSRAPINANAPTAPIATSATDTSLVLRGKRMDGSTEIVPNTRESKLAPYLNAWRSKIERLGTRGADTSMVFADEAPETAIVRIAREHDVDLVVVGSHGRSGLDRLLVGSVSEAVAKNAECDVLIESRGDPEVAAVIRGFRDRLIAEHLGVPIGTVMSRLNRARAALISLDRPRLGPCVSDSPSRTNRSSDDPRPGSIASGRPGTASLGRATPAACTFTRTMPCRRDSQVTWPQRNYRAIGRW